MSLHRKRQDFSPTCDIGKWYSCGYGSKFLGCCTSDPCANDCPAGNLQSAGFNPAYYGTFPDASCSAGSFYTCSSGRTTFLGCCKSNPCTNNASCPQADLAGAYIGNPNIMSAYSATGGSVPASLAAVSSRSGAATSTSVLTSSASIASTPTTTISGNAIHKSSVGAIAGGAASGGIVASVLVGLIWFLLLRHRKKKSEQTHIKQINTGLIMPPTPKTTEKAATGGRNEGYYAPQHLRNIETITNTRVGAPPPSYTPISAVPSSAAYPTYLQNDPFAGAVYRHEGVQGPQELPASTVVVPGRDASTRKVAYGVAEIPVSELSGESQRVEMESADQTPYMSPTNTRAKNIWDRQSWQHTPVEFQRRRGEVQWREVRN